MDSDVQWRRDRDHWDWTLPPPAPRPLRWPVIRWFRAVALTWRINRHYAPWGALGFLWTGYDDWVLYAVRRGWV